MTRKELCRPLTLAVLNHPTVPRVAVLMVYAAEVVNRTAPGCSTVTVVEAVATLACTRAENGGTE